MRDGGKGGPGIEQEAADAAVAASGQLVGRSALLTLRPQAAMTWGRPRPAPA